MGKELNAAKNARKENKEAEALRQKVTAVTFRKKNGTEIPAMVTKDGLHEAITANARAMGKNEIIQEQLEKDSKKKDYYRKEYNKQKIFLDAVGEMQKQ